MKYTINDIDVCILTHNRANLLAETIESILENTIVPDKITVLDNESSDNTEEVCRQYKKNNVVYVKTFGLDGNFFKSKEIATRKWLIRFHDDNLINIHFLEEMLNILNQYENIAIATGSYKLFFTGYEASFPYDDITDKIKNVYSKKPLEKNVILINGKKDFIAELIKRYNNKELSPIGSTPFLVVNTKIFKEFQHKKELYGKADDVCFYLFALEYGCFACLSDTNTAFFRAHPNRDSETDDNSLDLNQVENWTRMFVETFKEEKDPEIWKGFYCMFYAVFPAFLKKKLAKTYSNKALLKYLFECGALPSFASEFYDDEETLKRTERIQEEEHNILISYTPANKTSFNNPMDNLSGIEKYISVKNFIKNGVKRKYLIIFGFRIRLWKVKPRQKNFQ